MGSTRGGVWGMGVRGVWDTAYGLRLHGGWEGVCGGGWASQGQEQHHTSTCSSDLSPLTTLPASFPPSPTTHPQHRLPASSPPQRTQPPCLPPPPSLPHREDGVVLQQLHNHELRLKLGHHGHGGLHRGQHKAGQDVRLLRARDAQAQVLACKRGRETRIWEVRGGGTRAVVAAVCGAVRGTVRWCGRYPQDHH